MSNNIYNGKFLDFIAIPLTSNPNARDHTVLIDMATGSLPLRSVAKVDKIFSIEQSLVVRTFGQVRQDILDNIRSELLNLIS
jgi:mRNA interferase MazF